MAKYGVVRAYRTPQVAPDKWPATAACKRCGIIRAVSAKGPNRTGLCKSCNATLSKEEKKKWI